MERARACFTDSRRAAVECNESLAHALRMTGDGVTPAVIAPFMKCFHATLASMHTMLNAVAGTQLQITPKDYSDLSGFYNFIAQNWRVPYAQCSFVAHLRPYLAGMLQRIYESIRYLDSTLATRIMADQQVLVKSLKTSQRALAAERRALVREIIRLAFLNVLCLRTERAKAHTGL